MKKFTKIVASVSDRRCSEDFIRSLYEAGMNVVRMNTAHANKEGFDEIITNTRAVSSQIAILMDTKGPEVRTSICDEKIPYKIGEKVQIIGDATKTTTRACIAVSYPEFANDVQVGHHVLIDDGDLDILITGKEGNALIGEVQNEATLGSRKSVNVPGVKINLPSLTEKDRNNIIYAIEQDIDFIAHSFVRNKQDVLDIQEILDKHNSDIKIIAKIENQQGVDNIDEILEVAYGVMVARGDLGIEIPQERIPAIQRDLIRKCVMVKKPVIVATQMLHTMIEHPRPTRAEVADIANAIYQRTDALMLSGETAYGDYPIEAVKTMASIAMAAEASKIKENDIPVPSSDNDPTAFLAEQAVNASTKMNIRAIVTDSYTGRTARFLAAFRGKNPVLAVCYKEKTMRLLSLSFGVKPMYQEGVTENAQQYYFTALQTLLEMEMINMKDKVCYLSGSGGVSAGTSFLEINEVETVLKNAGHYVLPNFIKEKK